ncbi:ribbon-helix-helix domain-containing protein [Jiella sonneratiae]|uniref:Type II toxin-antitoxin system ParD family antitoxin n=1 Tax=Jiella sonneratiae TaxID=2816856 RepID=A0ABS3J3V1_9HYPH|nr:type II toxin-antitoxin system ParD family antitoxin [Jiella sonneratiae]MBO0903653.1 type II toxin-antitoxin system ParD family antitoxin [Jiella sonneratiae]
MGAEKSFNVQLAEDEARFVEDEVALGRFGSVSEVVAEAIRTFRAGHEPTDWSTEELRHLAEEGDRSGPSRFASIDEVKQEARRRLNAAQSGS